MQALQTVNEKVVDLYPYKFSISETRESPPRVVVAVRRLDGSDSTGNDSTSLKSIFADMEKWESFVQSASVIVKELGISQPGIIQNFQYSSEKYDITEDTTGDGTLRRFYLHMYKDERYRRQALNLPRPTSAEIATGIANVAKWRSLAETSKLLRSFWK